MALVDTIQQSFVGDNPQQASNPVATGYQANGAAAAPLINQLLANMQDTQDRSMRASDTSNAMNQNVLQQSLLDNANREKQRGITGSELDMQKGLYDSGLKKNVAESGLQAEFSKNLASKSLSELTDSKTKAEHYLAMEQMLDSAGPGDMQKKWKSAVDAAEKLGIKGFSKDYSIDEEAKMRAGAAFARNNLETINKMMLEQTKGSEARKTQGVANEPHVMAVEADEKKARLGMDRYTAEAYRAADKGEASAGQLQLIQNQIDKSINPLVKANPDYALTALKLQEAKQALLDAKPKDMEKAQAEVIRLTKELSDIVRKGPGTPPTGAAAAAPKPVTPTGEAPKTMTQNGKTYKIPPGAEFDHMEGDNAVFRKIK